MLRIGSSLTLTCQVDSSFLIPTEADVAITALSYILKAYVL